MLSKNRSGTTADTISSFLVLVATGGMIGFNILATTGYVNGVLTVDVSERYPTVVTPANWAFTIWIPIYAGLAGFAIYQLLPAKLAQYRSVRTLYLISCALNCLWLWLWYNFQIAGTVVVILSLWAVLLLLAARFREASSFSDALFGKGVFGLYFGWVTTAALANIAVLLVAQGFAIPAAAFNAIGAVMLLIAAAASVFARFKLLNFLFPLAVAWAAAGIGVAQSGNTIIVVAAAFCLVVGLVMAISFVMDRKGTFE